MIKGLIFDLDGVIVFTDKYHYKAWKQIADEENIYFDEMINNRLRGVSRMESLEIILEKASKKYTQKEKEDLAFKKNEIYKEYLKNMIPNDVSDDTLQSLKKLKEEGVLIAIGSSSKNAKLILKQVGLIDLFDAISDGTNISKSKPDPEVFLKAAEMLHLSPSECGVVEDAKAGIDAANKGGFTSFGIGDASDYLLTTHKISCLNDLIKYVK